MIMWRVLEHYQLLDFFALGRFGLPEHHHTRDDVWNQVFYSYHVTKLHSAAAKDLLAISQNQSKSGSPFQDIDFKYNPHINFILNVSNWIRTADM